MRISAGAIVGLEGRVEEGCRFPSIVIEMSVERSVAGSVASGISSSLLRPVSLIALSFSISEAD